MATVAEIAKRAYCPHRSLEVIAAPRGTPSDELLDAKCLVCGALISAAITDDAPAVAVQMPWGLRPRYAGVVG